MGKIKEKLREINKNTPKPDKIDQFCRKHNLEKSDVLDTIEKVSVRFSHFKFGIHGADDIEQFSRMACLKVLDKYDGVRKLENFLHVAVKRLVINLHRDELIRKDPPCRFCHNSIDGHTDHPDHHYCKSYMDWVKRNKTKQNIAIPLDLSSIDDTNEENTRDETGEFDLTTSELIAIVDEYLPAQYRQTYLKMKSGVKVPKAERLEVERLVLEILKVDL